MTEASPITELTYEQALSELEEIVAQLEGDQHTLEEAIRIFERGQALAQHCTGLLDRADLKVQQLLGDQIVALPDL